jgi:putative polyhydroxyalkanoate system protein
LAILGGVPSIAITRRHALPHDEARAAADRVARELADRFGITHAWAGDDLRFSRPGVSGLLRVTADHVALTLDLGLRFAPLRASVEREVRRQLDALFGTTP